MKAIRGLIIAIAVGLGMQTFADTDDLIVNMKQQQKVSEKKIVDMWNANQRGDELDKALSDYVVREVRLRSVSGTNQTGTILSKVLKGGEAKYKNPHALAQAVVMENLRRRGIVKSSSHFVSGRYLILNADVEVYE